MSSDNDVERFVKDPGLLVELCREVIEQLDVGSEGADMGEKETQLREISRTIERLEKAGVAIPDALRAEKTRLAAVLGTTTDATQTLRQLGEDLAEILQDLKARLRQDEDDTGHKKPRGKRSRTAKTDRLALRDNIIRTLKRHGGRAQVADVLREVGRQLKGKLLSGDLEVRKDGKTIAWMNNAQWERLRMVREGVLRSDSPNGIWELAEEDR
jgi:hypothetical protein